MSAQGLLAPALFLFSSLAAAEPLKPELKAKIDSILKEGRPAVTRLAPDERQTLLQTVLDAREEDGQFSSEQLDHAADLLKVPPAERLKHFLNQDSPLSKGTLWDSQTKTKKLTLSDLAPRYDWQTYSPAEARLNALPKKNTSPPPDTTGVSAKLSNAGDRKVGIQFLSADGGKTMTFETTAGVDAQGRPDFSGSPRFPQFERAIQNGIDGFFGVEPEKPKPQASPAPGQTASGAQAAGPQTLSSQEAPTATRPEAIFSDFKARPLWNPGHRAAGAVFSAAVWGAKVTAQGAGRLKTLGSAGPESRLTLEKDGVTAAVVSAPLDDKALVYQAGYALPGGRFGGEYNAVSGEKALNSEFTLSPGASLGTQAKLAPNQQSISVFFRITDLFK